jgi:diaminopimelate epimerase
MTMASGIAFTKMSGAGNDFLVLDRPAWLTIEGDRRAWVRAVCRRGLSVGADGVLVVSPGEAGRVEVEFFNPDGSGAFCGNGSRCAARYAKLRGIAAAPSMILATAAGEVPAVVSGAEVRLILPPPSDLGEVVLDGPLGTFRGRFVTAGVPHVVIPVSGLASYPVERAGPALRRHERLGPAGANVNFVENDESGRVHVRTFERGVENETLACGSGAVAVAMAARLAGAPETVVVVPRSGSPLTVSIAGDPRRPVDARLTGDARLVFEGILDSEATSNGR